MQLLPARLGGTISVRAKETARSLIRISEQKADAYTSWLACVPKLSSACMSPCPSPRHQTRKARGLRQAPEPAELYFRHMCFFPNQAADLNVYIQGGHARREPFLGRALRLASSWRFSMPCCPCSAKKGSLRAQVAQLASATTPKKSCAVACAATHQAMLHACLLRATTIRPPSMCLSVCICPSPTHHTSPRLPTSNSPG